MTDAELRDAGVAELKLTTQGYLKSNGQPRSLVGAQWKKGLDLLAQIGQAVPPPPPPSGVISPPANLATLHANAQPGAVIRLGAGSFGNQILTLNKPITFIGEPGAVLGDVSFKPGCGQIELKSSVPFGMKIGLAEIGRGSGAPASAITLRDLDGRVFDVFNALRTRIYGCDWGPSFGSRPRIQMWTTSERPIDTLIDGNWIYGMTMTAGDPNYHADGILIFGGNGLVIRNNIFGRSPAGVVNGNGGTGDLAIFFRTDPLIANIIVEDNQAFSPPYSQPGDAYYNVQYDRQIPGLVFTSNVFPKGMIGFGTAGSLPPQPPPPNWPPA